MVRLRGVAISDDEARKLARRLRACGDPTGIAVAERLERGVLMGTAIVGTSRPEATIMLNAIEEWTAERLRDVAQSLVEFVAA